MRILSKKKTEEILGILDSVYPDAECALTHENPFQLIVAVALSAQTTDASVNKVTPQLFGKYPDAKALSLAEKQDVEKILKTIGMYRTKSKNIINMARELCTSYNGEVPEDYNELIKLSGVGRKTANVVLSVAFGQQRIAVDTHVFRLANRMGIVSEKNELKTELALMERIPELRWSKAHHSLIFHGRNRCMARNPQCEECEINSLCKRVGIK